MSMIEGSMRWVDLLEDTHLVDLSTTLILFTQLTTDT